MNEIYGFENSFWNTIESRNDTIHSVMINANNAQLTCLEQKLNSKHALELKENLKEIVTG